MIRSYTINELEQLTAYNKRTISDYITKGLLAGPSHRGRGAVYSQRDLNVLKLIPRLRTLMKDEYGTLRAVAGFLSRLSIPDIQALANRGSERAFVVEVRRLRVRMSLMALMPQVSPERFDQVLDQLSPEQICSIDAGRLQIGAVIDMSQLFAQERAVTAMDDIPVNDVVAAVEARADELLADIDIDDTLAETDEVQALDESAINGDASEEDAANDTRQLLALKLDEIANRLDRVERMLEFEAEV